MWSSGKSIVALIPARSGSQRIPGKNIKPLNGHPLIAYTIAAAKASGIFCDIIVSTDSAEIAKIAWHYGARTAERAPQHATNESPDVEWIHDLLTRKKVMYEMHGPGLHVPYEIDELAITADYFAILRPTSPFRSAETIKRAWSEFERSACDSLRAVQPASVNPHKLWWLNNCELMPLLPTYDVPPWHSRPTQTLPPVYQQNASLEMSKCSLVRDRLFPSITGPRIWGFLNPEPEGFDLNEPSQWDYAEMKIANGEWRLPTL